jgi:raffinose/stachyose/melibiose transport system permease protein
MFLLALAAATLFPLIAFGFAALQPAGSPVVGLVWPSHPHWSNFAHVWNDAGFSHLVVNSLKIIVVVVPCTLVAATLAGYAFGTLDFSGRAIIYTAIVLGLTMPIEMIIIPVYYDFQSLGLVGGYMPVILTEIGLFMPFGVFWMTAYFRSIPRTIIEAAEVDGASSLGILVRVLLPGARPALATLGVLSFVWSWNQFLLVLVLIQDPSLRTAPGGLGYFIGEYSVDIPSLAAASFVVMAPPLLIYLFFQRRFITGMLAGAVKE